MKLKRFENLWPCCLAAILVTACAGDGETTGFWQEMQADVAVNSGRQRTGEEVYQYRCRACHGKNTQGAPMPGDSEEWQRRARRGMDVLMAHAVDGFKQTMPPRGGCRDCSELELRRALEYMMQQTEIRFEGNSPP
ncbi:MAG: c-type cytochrome [Gammaproteobacteria bacterium]